MLWKQITVNADDEKVFWIQIKILFVEKKSTL
jgi:hypothetical protein